MYDAKEYFFIDNLNDRYSIGMLMDGVQYKEDGSLNICIQKESSSKDLESNCLPAPHELFFMFLRMDLPREEVLEGTYVIPPVMKKTNRQE